MRSLQEIEAFVAVAEHGSFAAAGPALGVSSSYVSKLVSRLEQRLGVQLLRRTTRRLTLTAPGEQYVAECRAAFSILQASEEQLRESSSALRGSIRLTAPTALGVGVIADLIHQFCARHTELRVHVDYLDRFVDLVGEHYDFAVRAGPLPDSSLRARRVGLYRKRLVASPALARSLGPLEEPRDLRNVRSVSHVGQQRPDVWTLTCGSQVQSVAVNGVLSSNNGRALARAAAAGLGVTYLPEFHTRDLEEAGELVVLLPEWGEAIPVHLVYVDQRHMSVRVRALLDHLAQGLRPPNTRPTPPAAPVPPCPDPQAGSVDS